MAPVVLVLVLVVRRRRGEPVEKAGGRLAPQESLRGVLNGLSGVLGLSLHVVDH
jgi:hypothetical protein